MGNKVLEKIKEILSAQFEVDADTITADTDIVDDPGADSLDLVDMLMSLEDEFNIGEVPDEMIEKIRTVGQLVTYIEENM
jgi:acyl carrier protein